MFRMALRLASLLTLCVFLALLSGSGCAFAPGGTEANAYEFDPADVHLGGTFAYGPEIRMEAGIRNVGDGSFVLWEIELEGCDEGLTVSLLGRDGQPATGPMTIPEGEARRFYLNFRPTGSAEFSGCFAKPRLSDYGGEYPLLDITYSSEAPACVLQPSQDIDFGAAQVGEASEASLQVGNLTDAAEDVNRIMFEFTEQTGECGSFAFQNDQRSGVVGPGMDTPATREVGLTFQPSQAGYFECAVTLESWMEAESRPAAHLSLGSGECPSPITLKGTGVEPMESVVTACKYEDPDGDLATPEGRTRVPDWPVHLSDGNGIVGNGLTDQDGCYTWTSLGQGVTYTVEEDVPAGWMALTATAKSFDASEPGQSYAFDFVNSRTVDVQACKLQDADGDLAGTPGDQSAVSGWTVYLADETGIISEGVTDAEGCHTWTDLAPGPSYRVLEEERAGWTALTSTVHDFGPTVSGESYSHTFINYAGVLVQEWTDCSPPANTLDHYGLFGTPGGAVYVVGASGTVLVSRSACTWAWVGTALNNIDEVHLTDLWVSDDEETIWAAGTVPPPPGMYGGTGTIVRLREDTWSVFDQTFMEAYWTVWGSGLNDVWFGGTGISTDFPNAKHWVGEESDLETAIISDMGMTSVSGLSGTGAQDIWAVLRQGEYPAYRPIYRYRGTGWAEEEAVRAVLDADQEPQPLNGVYAVQSASFYAVYAVGDAGKIYHYDGSAWENESISTTNSFYDAWVNPTSGEVWVVGENGAIYRKDAGAGGEWELQTIPSTASGTTFYAIGAAGSDLYVTGTGGVTLRLLDGAL